MNSVNAIFCLEKARKLRGKFLPWFTAAEWQHSLMFLDVQLLEGKTLQGIEEKERKSLGYQITQESNFRENKRR